MFRYTAPQLHSFVPPLHLCRSLNTFLSRKAESYARSFRPLLALSSVRARRQAHRRQREAANIEGATAKGWREGEREGGRKEGLANHRRRRRWLLMLEASYTCGIGGAEKKKKKRKKEEEEGEEGPDDRVPPKLQNYYSSRNGANVSVANSYRGGIEGGNAKEKKKEKKKKSE